MKRLNLEVAVGVFVLAGLLCLTYLAVKLGDLGLFEEETYEVTAKFVSVSGLKEGAFVEIAGVRVGNVARIDLDAEDYPAQIHMTISSKYPVQEDAIASIRTQGIIGDKFVKIAPGGGEPLEDGMELIETEPAISLEELISKYIFESNNK